LLEHKQMTMKKLLFLSLIALGLAACEKDDNTGPAKAHLDVVMEATYDGQLMETFKKYPYDTYNLQFTRFHTYLSDIELIRADGSAERLTDIAFVDFTPDNAPSALSVRQTLPFHGVPVGEYTGIRMGVGVKPSLNAKNPGNFPANHPLFLENEYWLGWKSYIFTKVEGRGDQDMDGTDDYFMVHHYGSDPVYRTVTIQTPIRVAAEGASALALSIDLRQLFTMADGTWYNLPANPQTSHMMTDISIASVVVDHFQRAFSAKNP